MPSCWPRPRKAQAASAKYAAIVVDANSGKTLYATNADAPRYPASLTKMMTLYLVFEALNGGRLSMNSKVPFSAQAAAEPPTKLGVKAGSRSPSRPPSIRWSPSRPTIPPPRSASFWAAREQNFARMMTAKARRLGMTGTTFQNAYGLPDPDQRTTARDMATLGIALREHFPRYYKVFSATSFTYGKRRIANHNRLLGRVKGVDGIKTGYTRASGFNLVSSVADGNRRIVAVVMGGTSGGSRDAQMAELIRKYLPKASGRGGGVLVAKAGATPFAAIASAILPKRNAPTPDLRPAADVVVALDESAVLAAEEEQIAAQAAADEKPEPPALVETATEKPIVQAYADPAPRPKAAVDQLRTASTAPAGWAIQVASSPSEDEARGFLAATTKKAPAQLPTRRRFTPALRQGRHHLLPRPLRRLRLEDRRLERLQRAEEEEDRLLRHRAVDGASTSLPEEYRVEGELVVIGEQDVLGFVDPSRQEGGAADVGVQALHQASVRLADLRRARPRFKTKDLVGLLLSHGARTWRNSLPVAVIRLRVFAPCGKPAVKIRF